MPLSSNTPLSLPDLSAEDLADWMVARGYKGIHAPRVLRNLYAVNGGTERSSARMPAGMMALLADDFPSAAASLAMRQVAADGTCKLLLRLADGRTVESVLMPDFHPQD